MRLVNFWNLQGYNYGVLSVGKSNWSKTTDREEDDSVANYYWSIWVMTRAFFCFSYPLLFYILFIMVIMLTINPCSADGKGVCLKVKGPGFDSRSQHFLYFLNIYMQVPCSTLPNTHHTLQPSSHWIITITNPAPHDASLWYISKLGQHRIKRVDWADQQFLGLNNSTYTPLIASK